MPLHTRKGFCIRNKIKSLAYLVTQRLRSLEPLVGLARAPPGHPMDSLLLRDNGVRRAICSVPVQYLFYRLIDIKERAMYQRNVFICGCWEGRQQIRGVS